jgi:Uma2 family endonuclease
MTNRKPPTPAIQDPEDLPAEPDPSELVHLEDGLVLPMIPEDPEHSRMVDPQD